MSASSIPPATLLAALPAAEFSASIPDLANAGAVSSIALTRKRSSTTLPLLDQIEAGTDPLAGKRGDFRWAYRSDVDGEIQPYRVFVPRTYNREKKYPGRRPSRYGWRRGQLLCRIHNGLIKRLAEQHGYIVVCPKGRNPASMYLGSAEKDVMDVIAEARRLFRSTAIAIYLDWPLMGGYGTWSTGVVTLTFLLRLRRSPAAVCHRSTRSSRKSSVPAIVIHGDHDPTVSVEESRRMVQALQKLGAEVKYIEVPGGNHVNVVALPKRRLRFLRRAQKGSAGAQSGGFNQLRYGDSGIE